MFDRSWSLCYYHDMAQKKEYIVKATVVEALPNTMFRVRLMEAIPEEIRINKADTSDTPEIIAYLSGKMRLHRIRVMIGDSVEVLLDTYGGKARITRRT